MRVPKLAAALVALMLANTALNASGPVAPKGWRGDMQPTLSNGQPCCIPADLNGTGLTGGAFVFISDDKTAFALFGLTYTAGSDRDRWQLLEKHPISKLPGFRVTIEQSAEFPHGAIRACESPDRCLWYTISGDNRRFRRILLKRKQ